MLVALIIAPFNDLSRMGLVLFNSCVREEADIVVHVKVEEWTRLAASFVDNEVVESVVLKICQNSSFR